MKTRHSRECEDPEAKYTPSPGFPFYASFYLPSIGTPGEGGRRPDEGIAGMTDIGLNSYQYFCFYAADSTAEAAAATLFFLLVGIISLIRALRPRRSRR
ncbi:hypothetical protein BH10PSE19_BH10PSE19_16390 [soil metagenome]